MKIRVSAGLFDSRVYDLEIKDGAICIHRGKEPSTRVPLPELKGVSVEGGSRELKRFVLETGDSLYEGTFLYGEDAATFVERLCRESGCRLSISLDNFEEGQTL